MVVKMKPLAEPALKVVLDGQIKFYPDRWTKSVRTLDDQHPRLVYFAAAVVGSSHPGILSADGSYIVARSKEDALAKVQASGKYPALSLQDIQQDSDVLDTCSRPGSGLSPC